MAATIVKDIVLAVPGATTIKSIRIEEILFFPKVIGSFFFLAAGDFKNIARFSTIGLPGVFS
jgi:hypothetical protein